MNNIRKANDFVRQVQNTVLDISLPGWFILLSVARRCRMLLRHLFRSLEEANFYPCFLYQVEEDGKTTFETIITIYKTLD